ncbi:DUF6360 family protein [Halobellus ordinarius]|uniref:DUF6360 family protein n=1 Tax=Halobellus ordinarius TaxID=3075120 RepID=UPI0028803806|nr:DUF6360 family protein [Halobellus sp. ZY16]
MPNRLLKVNAYTTLDLVDATARGHDFADSGVAVLNVTSPRENPDHIKLQLELDNTHLESLPAHADEVTLSPSEARTVADALQSHADKVEAAADNGDDAVE